MFSMFFKGYMPVNPHPTIKMVGKTVRIAIGVLTMALIAMGVESKEALGFFAIATAVASITQVVAGIVASDKN